MTMLHTVNKSPFERNSLESCLNHCTEGSAVLMIEDGVYGAIKGSSANDKITGAVEKCKLYVLGPDAAARGIKEDQVIDGVTIVDYSGFVDLVAEHDAVQSWL